MTKQFPRLIAVLVLAVFGQSGSPTFAGEIPVGIDAFLSDHCFECHDDLSAEADLDLTSLEFDLSNPRTLEEWELIFERVEAGEMPPEKKPQPEAGEKKKFLAGLEKPLHEADRKFVSEYGRVHGRRLTREQYETTLHDLLGIDIPLVDYLPPAEGREFETLAEEQQLSHFHLEKYLAAADAALHEAFARAGKKDVDYKRTFRAPELTAKGRGNYRGPEARNGKTIVWRMNLQFVGRLPKTAVPESGWYRITIENFRGINPGRDGSVWGSIRTGACSSDEPILNYAATVEAIDEPRTETYEVWMEKGHMLEFEPNEGTDRAAPSGATGGNVSFKGRDLEKDGFAGIEFDSITMERFHPHAKSWEIRKKLFPGVKFEKGQPVIEEPKKEIHRLVGTFAEAAFRRPISDAVILPYRELAEQHWNESKSFTEAIRVAYRALLCSPRFLEFVEPPGKLDDYSIASRLSYFLWNTLPDQRLLVLAKEKKLQQPEVLSSEVERMLGDERFDRFVKSFSDQWLELKRIDFTTPDSKRFSRYDPILQDSMVRETRAFLGELIRENLGVSHFVASDFAMWNTRLREHYGDLEVDVKPGGDLQKVSLSESKRGGLVTQGSVLKVTADGSVTSPVIRGVWVNERILGLETPPPPPNVPAVEPDIRGATSIRDQLSKHRDNESCAACHAKIDPAGFALENFDPVGQWRTAYGGGKKAAKVDPSGTTPDGEPFAGIGQWKNIYSSRPDMLAEAFARNLLTYAVGGHMRFSDRDSIDQIVAAAKLEGYGLRSILKAAVASPIFLSK